MGKRFLAAAAACLLAVGALRAETRREVLGPIILKGRHAAMEGPHVTQTPRFRRSGWLTAYAVHVLDASGLRRDHDGIFCHAVLADVGRDDSEKKSVSPANAVFSEAVHLLASEGQNEIRFPQGFGIPVHVGETFAFEAMLQSDDESNDGAYRFEVETETLDAGDGPALQSLSDFMVRIQDPAGGHSCGGQPGFSAPPGLHAFETRFKAPSDARIHYMTTHLHRYAKEILLQDAATGEELYRSKVKAGPSGHPVELPFYSSTTGLPLARGREYIFRAWYQNPTSKPVMGMANLRLYFRDTVVPTP
jgi:hypothetical protein